MDARNRLRRENIASLLAFLLLKLEPQAGKGLNRNKTLNAYSYEVNISLRTLTEYVDILVAAGLLKLEGYASTAYLYPVVEAS